MLAFARRQELRPEIVDVPALVESMVEMLGRSLGPNISISTAFEAGVPATRVDPNQLELAILNLALNARDAMPKGGRLHISAQRQRLGASEVLGLAAGDYLCLAEADSGVGMDETTLKRAAEPFFTTKGAGHGTGLGLSMVDGLVAQSGGAMRIRSEPGAGTTVELWLPTTESAVTAVPRAPPAPPVMAGRPYRVLVVDDDPGVAEGTAAILEDLGHATVTVDSGERALDVLELDRSIDVVITDHAMPRMTGTELAARIRRKWPRLPVVLASGYADLPEDEQPELPRLSKPYRQADVAVLLAALDRGGWSTRVTPPAEQPAPEPAT
jgi:CheY-like chemotaxis protein